MREAEHASLAGKGGLNAHTLHPNLAADERELWTSATSRLASAACQGPVNFQNQLRGSLNQGQGGKSS